MSKTLIFLNRLKGYVLRQTNLFYKIRRDITEIETLCKEAASSQKKKILLNYYTADAKRKERSIERIERNLNILINRLLKIALPKKEEELSAMAEELTRLNASLFSAIERIGDLLKTKEYGYWRKIETLLTTLLGETVDDHLDKGIIAQLFALIDKLKSYSKALDSVPYGARDAIPKDYYYGAHLGVARPEQTHSVYRHEDHFSARDRFEADLKNIDLPVLPRGFIFSRKKIILDAGCSVGFTTNSISQRYPSAKVIGLEIDERLLSRARRYFPRLTFMNGDFYFPDTLFPPNYFDLIFMGNNLSLALDSLEEKNLRAIMERIKVVLKEGGSLIVYDSVDGAIITRKVRAHYSYVTGKLKHVRPLFLEIIGFPSRQ
ncbi:class I SAM-dependent methyltransferase [Candidatus Woesearchaeota archaeon]|nr:class I SAM-dependent methyltransferase [Candidatus Woesearchaeota archaeon]